MTIYADNYVECYQISKSVLEEALGSNFKQILLMSIAKENFNLNNILNIFTFNHLLFSKVYSAFKINLYNSKQYIKKKSTDENKIIILLDGDITKVNIKYKLNIEKRWYNY
jgi:hypothetical protein